MSKFTARAYVKVSDNARRTLTEKLSTISGLNIMDSRDNFIVLANGEVSTIHPLGVELWLFCHTEYLSCNYYTDTEEDAIELFSELAQMRSDTENQQWFERTKDTHLPDLRFFKSEAEVFRGYELDSKLYMRKSFKKLTSLELAENWRTIKATEIQCK